MGRRVRVLEPDEPDRDDSERGLALSGCHPPQPLEPGETDCRQHGEAGADEDEGAREEAEHGASSNMSHPSDGMWAVAPGVCQCRQ